MTATPNLLYVYRFGTFATPFDDAVDFLPVTGGTPGVEGTDPNNAAGFFSGLAIDAAAGVYFVSSRQTINGVDNYFIYEEQFDHPATFTAAAEVGGGAVAIDPSGLGNAGTNAVRSLAINASDDILYFTSGSGFFEEKFSGANFSGAATKIQLATLPSAVSASDDQLAFDQADHTAYFAAPKSFTNIFTVTTAKGKQHLSTTRSVTANFIYKVSNVTAGATANSLSATTVNLGGPGGELPLSDGVITGVALDSANDTLYITTRGQGTNAPTAGIFAYDIHNSALSTVWSQSVSSSTTSLDDMTYITIDPATGNYYVTDGVGGGGASKHPGIYTGNVNSHAAPTLLISDPLVVSGGQTFTDNFTLQLALDPAPTISSVAVTAIDGNTSKSTGTVTTADTVAISVTFNENVTFTASPTLTLNDGGVATLTGGGGSSTLQFSYTPVSGQNVSTLASTGLSGGTITDLALTPADGANIAKTFTGLGVETTPPTITVTAASSNAIQGGAAITLLGTATLTDVGGPGTISKAIVTIESPTAGDQLSITGISGGKVDGGLVTVTGAGSTSLTLTGAAPLGDYRTLLQSVTYQDTGSGAATTRKVDWVVSDGVLSSAAATSTTTIYFPPTVTAGASVTYHGGQSTGVGLDLGLTINDPETSTLTSATLTIASGYLSGDTLSYAVQNGITGAQNGATLTLSGSASLAAYQAALRSIGYFFLPQNGDPTNGGVDKTRIIDWTVNDGVASSAVATSTLTVTPCFGRGALILTTRGEVAVEDLKVGDRAVTFSGAPRPIVWIGHRRLDISRHPDPAAVRPVRVAAGAFGRNLPRRNLWLSPGHNIMSEGVLMPISSLVNGVSVEQVDQPTVEYWHVELDAHDVILAEGLPAESYLDTGNRTGFENSGAFIEAHPDFSAKHWAETCLPLMSAGAQVRRTRARLFARLAECGFERVEDADAHMIVDGQRIDPIRLSAWRLAFVLPEGGQSLALHSRLFVPSHTMEEGDDTRALGLCVARMEVDGAAVSLEALDAAEWHETQFSDTEAPYRWTRGCAMLPKGARIVRLDLAGFGRYWRETDVARVAAAI